MITHTDCELNPPKMASGDRPVDEFFTVETNARGKMSASCSGHISIKNLHTKIQNNKQEIMRDLSHILNYLNSDIPEYPTPVDFHTSDVTHVTDKYSLQKIWESEGFKAHGSENKFSWWSLKINEECIKAAENRYLEKVFPNRTQEQREEQQPFLSKFTTSPPFNEKSRYGNFQFTFPLNELMNTYKNQMCKGQDPVLRAYKTIFYKQEIMYVVLVHSPDVNEEFEKFPVIESSPFFAYKDNQIIWSAQAICKNFAFSLFLNKEDKKAEIRPSQRRYYVWDHVTLAFHFSGVLKFPKCSLRNSITYCDIDEVNLSRGTVTREEAEKILDTLQ